MPRIHPVADPDERQGALLAKVKAQLGRVPNILATMAQAPALLEGYLGFSQTLGQGTLSAAEREAIALLVAGRNGCHYCAAAHTAIGKLAKVPGQELAANLTGQSGDPRRQALLDLAGEVLADTGRVSDATLARVRAAGYDDAQILETVGQVALNVFTNSLNHLAGTVVDFPAVAVPSSAEAA